VTEEMEVETRGENETLAQRKTPTQQLGLGAPQQMDENDDERTESDEPRGQAEESTKPVAEPVQQSEEVLVEDVTGQQDSDAEEEEDTHQEAGPSTVTMKTKGKQTVQRSPCKQKEVTLTLPCIPEGVKILPGILGCVDKLKYSDHDIADRDKFPEFAPQVYMERKGTRSIRGSNFRAKAVDCRIV
jgi:hypothetical protein